MIKAVIFDVGGVINYEVSLKIHKAIAKKIGLSLEEERAIARRVIHKFQVNRISENDFWKKLADKLNSDVGEIKQVWLKTFERNVRTRKNMIKLALDLKGRGYKIAILSNVIKTHADHISSKNIYQMFSPVVLSFEVGMDKPHKNIYLYTAKQLGLKPEECVFIDDREHNARIARKVGMHAIVFKNIKQLKKELEKVL